MHEPFEPSKEENNLQHSYKNALLSKTAFELTISYINTNEFVQVPRAGTFPLSEVPLEINDKKSII